MAEKNYCLVGTGSRSFMYVDALFGTYSAYGELKGICDTNPVRMDYINTYVKEHYNAKTISQYRPADFERMLEEQQAQTVIITSMDRTHHDYIIRAMRCGCDVISEKPMTIDCEKAEEIFKTIHATGRKLTVTFNYRYAPRNAKVKELLQQGIIGDVKSVHFEWLLDTKHGADYFRRWHRDKKNSGGLMVHKATHHFDLMNWWLDSEPLQVYAEGNLVFYGRENAENRGITQFYTRGTDNRMDDPFALDLNSQMRNKELYLKAEREDGYLRDLSVFSQGISIEDDIAVMVKYKNKAVMSYHLTAYSPWEGYRVNFNGTKGRLEFDVVENAYVSGDEQDHNRKDIRDQEDFKIDESAHILIRPHWATPYEVTINIENEGGHGGGDDRLLRDLFVGVEDDPLGCAADHLKGAWSILTGIAANESMKKTLPVNIQDLIRNFPMLHAHLI
jgi:predicted dehydrogenase